MDMIQYINKYVRDDILSFKCVQNVALQLISLL